MMAEVEKEQSRLRLVREKMVPISPGLLFVKEPRELLSSLLGPGPKAICTRGVQYEVEKYDGRGIQLGVDLARNGARVLLDGDDPNDKDDKGQIVDEFHAAAASAAYNSAQR